jgi:hypothetical protein
MTPLARWLALCMVLGMIIAPLSFTVAQDDPEALDEHPLMEMLALLPDTAAIRMGTFENQTTLVPWITFVNYRAALEADPGFPYPADFADYTAQVEQGREAWRSAPIRIYTEPELPVLWQGTGEGRDPETLQRAGPIVGEAMELLTGMEYFDIHTGMAFGLPPIRGMVFGGDLDLDAISAAHMARDYTENIMQGVRVWCSGKYGGCENPTEYDARGIEPYNVFDTRMGRQPPFIGVEKDSVNYIAGVFDYDLLLTMIDTAAGSHDSLADAEDYRTLAGALIDSERFSGTLIQTYLIPGPMTSTAPDMMSYILANDISIDEWVEPAEWADYGTLPLYSLMALADRQEGDDIVTMVVLLYPDVSDAEAALPELTARLTTFTSVLQWQTTEPVLTFRPGNPAIQDSYVYTDAESDWAAAVVTLRNDFSYRENEDEPVSNINVLYSFYMRDIINQTFYPLWVADFSDWQSWGN